MSIKYKYNSLEDFMTSNPLNIDGNLNDGWGAEFPVKGIELEASILFADITSFSGRTLELSPIETLIFVNNFFSWISAEALLKSHGIIDKYIGDEIMVVFAKEFGSDDHFVDALRAARAMAENDVLSFAPHIGIASGPVVIGYVGTPLKYNCSVFGSPVALAARCASIKSTSPKSIIFPQECWKPDYDLDVLLPPKKWLNQDGSVLKEDKLWNKKESYSTKIKNMGSIDVIEITSNIVHFPSSSTTERAKESFKSLKENGFYRKFKKKEI